MKVQAVDVDGHVVSLTSDVFKALKPEEVGNLVRFHLPQLVLEQSDLRPKFFVSFKVQNILSNGLQLKLCLRWLMWG